MLFQTLQEFWPELNSTCHYADITVTLHEQHTDGDLTTMKCQATLNSVSILRVVLLKEMFSKRYSDFPD